MTFDPVTRWQNGHSGGQGRPKSLFGCTRTEETHLQAPSESSSSNLSAPAHVAPQPPDIDGKFSHAMVVCILFVGIDVITITQVALCVGDIIIVGAGGDNLTGLLTDAAQNERF